METVYIQNTTLCFLVGFALRVAVLSIFLYPTVWKQEQLIETAHYTNAVVASA